MAAFALLTLLLRRYPENELDLAVLRWVMSWDAPGLEAFMEAISWLTDLWPRVVLGVAGVVVIFVLGHRVAALSVAVTFVVLLGPIEFFDWASGVAVGRFRPNGAPFYAFPSGHTLGTVIMFGFVGYVVFRLPLGNLGPHRCKEWRRQYPDRRRRAIPAVPWGPLAHGRGWRLLARALLPSSDSS